MGKYAKIEYERRFLLPENLLHLPLLGQKLIEDHYILQSDLRLRKMSNSESCTFKLTQKKPLTEGDLALHEITTIYLTAETYQQFMESLPGIPLRKTRWYFQVAQHRVGVDEILIGTQSYFIMEVEFESATSMHDFPLYGMEVTQNPAYSGFTLAQQQLQQDRSKK